MTIIGSIGGTLGGIVSTTPLGGLVSGAADSAASLVLNHISSWVLNGTKSALEEVAGAISAATAPNLDSTWFSSTYWRVAALAAMLTIPFLCAAAVQAVARADLGMLARATFGYLPLALLGVSLAAPLTMLALAATDQMSAVVSASAATGGARFLDHAAETAGALASASGGSPFFAVVVGLLAVMAAMALAVELLVRAAAVYIVVLMLPLAFAAMVWPARRIWAVRLVELLSSLILSKFVIVAVLSLAGAAFTTGTPGVGELLVAMSLILLSTFAPWALMRILPFTELAAGAAGVLRNELPRTPGHAEALGHAIGGASLAAELPARLTRHARAMHSGGDGSESIALASTEPSPGGGRSSDDAASSGFSSGEGVSEEPAATPSPKPPAPATPASASSHRSSGHGESDDSPYVLAAAWRESEPVGLDGDLPGPTAAQAPSASEQPDNRPGSGEDNIPR